jgi:hypothetical protein
MSRVDKEAGLFLLSGLCVMHICLFGMAPLFSVSLSGFLLRFSVMSVHRSMHSAIAARAL